MCTYVHLHVFLQQNKYLDVEVPKLKLFNTFAPSSNNLFVVIWTVLSAAFIFVKSRKKEKRFVKICKLHGSVFQIRIQSMSITSILSIDS